MCAKTPQDLKGKRVGTTQYGATAIIYIKGMLEDEYGVAPADMNWFIGGLSTPTEKPLIPLNLPGNIQLEFLPNDQTLEAMLQRGELDALFSILIPKMFLEGSPGLLPAHAHSASDAYRCDQRAPVSRSPLCGEESLHRILPRARFGHRTAL
jgi:4,5-dihydroxyphthalate decarboxylase